MNNSKLPSRTKASKTSKLSQDKEDCSICLHCKINSYIENCKHEFCYSCIKKWSKKQAQCPLCRIEFDHVNYRGRKVAIKFPKKTHKQIHMHDMPNENWQLSSSQLPNSQRRQPIHDNGIEPQPQPQQQNIPNFFNYVNLDTPLLFNLPIQDLIFEQQKAASDQIPISRSSVVQQQPPGWSPFIEEDQHQSNQADFMQPELKDISSNKSDQVLPEQGWISRYLF